MEKLSASQLCTLRNEIERSVWEKWGSKPFKKTEHWLPYGALQKTVEECESLETVKHVWMLRYMPRA